MSIRRRIDMFFTLRRADRAAAKALAEKAARDHLNRPHVQSDHLIGVPPVIPQPAPSRRTSDLGIGPLYAACIICLIGLVAYVNTYHHAPGAMYACTQTQVATR